MIINEQNSWTLACVHSTINRPMLYLFVTDQPDAAVRFLSEHQHGECKVRITRVRKVEQRWPVSPKQLRGIVADRGV